MMGGSYKTPAEDALRKAAVANKRDYTLCPQGQKFTANCRAFLTQSRQSKKQSL
jgi:hypothetical protein